MIAGPDHTREPSVAGADERLAVDDLGQVAELLLGAAAAGPLLAAQALDGHVAVLVVQRGERPDEREQRVGRRAAVLAAVLGRRRACATSMVTFAMPRSATVSVGTPGPHAAHVADDHGVGGEELGVAAAGRSCSAPPPTSSWPSMTNFMPTGGRPSQARSAPTCATMFDFVSAAPRPYRRRRARSARRAACPTATRRRRARRRSGCRAAPSARRRGAGISPIDDRGGVGQLERGRPRTPASRKSRATRSCASRSGPSGRPSPEIDGMRTSASRSRRSSGISARTRAACSEPSMVPRSGIARLLDTLHPARAADSQTAAGFARGSARRVLPVHVRPPRDVVARGGRGTIPYLCM